MASAMASAFYTAFRAMIDQITNFFQKERNRKEPEETDGVEEIEAVQEEHANGAQKENNGRFVENDDESSGVPYRSQEMWEQYLQLKHELEATVEEVEEEVPVEEVPVEEVPVEEVEEEVPVEEVEEEEAHRDINLREPSTHEKGYEECGKGEVNGALVCSKQLSSLDSITPKLYEPTYPKDQVQNCRNGTQEELKNESDEEDEIKPFIKHFGSLTLEEQQAVKNVSFEDLNAPPGPEMILELASIFDDSIVSCLDIASQMKLKREQLTHLQNCYSGGGCAFKSLFESIPCKFYQKPTIFLVNAIKDPSIKAFVADLCKGKENKPLESFLQPNVCYSIVAKIKNLGPSESYRCFGDICVKLGYTRREIKHFIAAVRRNNQYSPMDEMFSFLIQNKPKMKVIRLFEALEPEGQAVMAKHLKTIVEK